MLILRDVAARRRTNDGPRRFGYCSFASITPCNVSSAFGMLMTATDPIRNDPRATDGDIREGACGNLRRCTRHGHIVGAGRRRIGSARERDR
jgi:aerobic-type carbon monoxide dehydrogenase small subunit (CoxS/CutS family)